MALQAIGDEQTRIILRVEGTVGAAELEGTAAGWRTQLRVLARFLSRPKEPRTSFAAMGSALVTREQAYAAFVLPGWLSDEPLPLQEGQRFSMHTLDGNLLSGTILSLVPGHEIALWCEELGGVVRMRSIPLADNRSRLLGLQVLRWGAAPQAEAIEQSLRHSAERLISLLEGPRGQA